MLALFVMAGLIGLIPAIVASNKGHSFGNWWLFGTLAFIVALPAALLVKSKGVADVRESTGAASAPERPTSALIVRARELVEAATPTDEAVAELRAIADQATLDQAWAMCERAFSNGIAASPFDGEVVALLSAAASAVP